MRQLLIALLFVPVMSFANQDSEFDSVIEVFKADSQVAARIAQAKAAQSVVEDGNHVLLLSSGCGFAGCTSDYLVTQILSHKGTNAYSIIVMAKVSQSSFLPSTVKLVDRLP